MEELIALISKTYGIAGLIMLSPFMGLVVVWRHNIKLQEQKDAQSEKFDAAIKIAYDALAVVQERRVTDAHETSAKILTLVAENATVSSEISQALDQVRDLLMKLTTALTSK